MIPFDFEYYRPDSITEAVNLFADLTSEGKEPRYYSGGTEIISQARLSQLFTGAVVDIKGIPECRVFELQNDKLIIGAATTLGAIEEANYFPLLTKTGGRVADHTSRDKITFGGNICGRFIYREAVLPLLLSDATLLLAGPEGIRTVNINDVFSEWLHLTPGEILIQAIVDGSFLQLPFYHAKKMQYGKIGYPLATISALKCDGFLRFAFSGLCNYPYRSIAVETYLNDNSLSRQQQIDLALTQMPPLFSSIEGSREYRTLVLRDGLNEALTDLEGVN